VRTRGAHKATRSYIAARVKDDGRTQWQTAVEGAEMKKGEWEVSIMRSEEEEGEGEGGEVEYYSGSIVGYN
jgi:hypothetical protein